VDVHVTKEAAFRDACQAGHVDVVWELLSLQGGRKVDVHLNNNRALVSVCRLYGMSGGQYRRETLAVLLNAGLDRLPSRALYDEHCKDIMGPFYCWVNHLSNRPRATALLRHRRAHWAHVDAGVLRGCCMRGRSLELQLRLVLGRLALSSTSVQDILQVCAVTQHDDYANVV